MSKRAHIRRRPDSDDEDNNQPADDDSNDPNSNDGSDNGYANLFLRLFFYTRFILQNVHGRSEIHAETSSA